MLLTIFKFEINFWLKLTSLYIYVILFFCIALLVGASSAGFFDSFTSSIGSSIIINSPKQINDNINGLSILILFLLPTIIGNSIYRDFKSDVYTILYAYPFTKKTYLLAKFFSGFTIVFCIVLSIAFGLFFGYRLPGTNTDLIGDFSLMSYLYSFFVFVIPNIFLFGAIVFGVVTFSRNIVAGFITILVLIFAQGLAESFLANPDNQVLGALLDPLGGIAQNSYTKYWTIAEQNNLELPIKSLIIYNRLFWLAIATAIFGATYYYFSFTQKAISFNFWKKNTYKISGKSDKNIRKIAIPKVHYNFSLKQNLKNVIYLAKIDFKYIISSRPFLAILAVGLIFLVLTGLFGDDLLGTKTLPVTRKMLELPGTSFSFFIAICTFLFSGLLIQRSKNVNLNFILDTTPTPNWVLLLSKYLALVKMQIVMLGIIMISGICIQVYKEFYHFEIGLYIIRLSINFIHFAIWGLLAMLIQTLVNKPYIGLFILLIIYIGIPFLSFLGIEESIFKYNEAPSVTYSDINGFGTSLLPHFIFKFYWLLAGVLTLIFAYVFWIRGIVLSNKERVNIAKKRITKSIAFGSLVVLVSFFSLGVFIYLENNIDIVNYTAKEQEQLRVTWEKEYKKYEDKAQPKLISVNVHLDIFPKTLDFKTTGTFTYVNKSRETISEIVLNHASSNYKSTYKFNKNISLIKNDSVFNVQIYKLDEPLLPRDSIVLQLTTKNKKNTFLNKKSPILANGTFLNNLELYPSLGYDSSKELIDDAIRKKYGLPKNTLQAHPKDTTALHNNYISQDADWIDFEAIISTSEDQIAIAPGYLKSEWKEKGRRYFHYKMDSKMLNFYAFNSGEYEIFKDKWSDVNLEIYYHKGHDYNLDRMMGGLKASLAYNSENFTPYQHKQMRIVEFPKTYGVFAQSFANTIPYSESIGFIAAVDDNDKGGVDYPYTVTAHEVAHQWWGHQVIGANVLGSTMLSESLSEYVSLKVLEHKYGKTKMRTFLKRGLDTYLSSRNLESKRENPLLYNDGQGYIHYEKGALVFYALSDYIGEKKLNSALQKYVEKVQFQKPPYTTSLELETFLKEATPDSLQYIFKDMFETITLYDNRIDSVKVVPLNNGKYKVDIAFNVRKYRNNEKGKIYFDTPLETLTLSEKQESSTHLNDFIDIGVFAKNISENGIEEVPIYLKKHRITHIKNKLSIIVDKKPIAVGVDPYNKLIDRDSEDNRRAIK